MNTVGNRQRVSPGVGTGHEPGLGAGLGVVGDRCNGDVEGRAWRVGIGPGGLEPPFPDPKSGVLPLDEGPATMLALKLTAPAVNQQALGPRQPVTSNLISAP